MAGAGKANRRDILAMAKQARGRPKRIKRTQSDFARNPYVVAGALIRAKGRCELPGCKTVLFRRDDGQPVSRGAPCRPARRWRGRRARQCRCAVSDVPPRTAFRAGPAEEAREAGRNHRREAGLTAGFRWELNRISHKVGSSFYGYGSASAWYSQL